MTEGEVEITSIEQAKYMSAVKYSEVLREKEFVAVVSMKNHVLRKLLLKVCMTRIVCL